VYKGDEKMNYVIHMAIGFSMLISVIFPFVGMSLHSIEPQQKIDKSQLMINAHYIQLTLLLVSVVTGSILLNGFPMVTWTFVAWGMYIIIITCVVNMIKNAKIVIVETKRRVYPRKIINRYINWSFLNVLAVFAMLFYKSFY
jgi:hypothetical protein